MCFHFASILENSLGSEAVAFKVRAVLATHRRTRRSVLLRFYTCFCSFFFAYECGGAVMPPL